MRRDLERERWEGESKEWWEFLKKNDKNERRLQETHGKYEKSERRKRRKKGDK